MRMVSKFRLKYYLPKTFLLRSFLIIVLPVLWMFVASGTVFLQRHWKYVANCICENIARNAQLLCMLSEENILPWPRVQRLGKDFFHIQIDKVYAYGRSVSSPSIEDSQSTFLYSALQKAFPLGVSIERTHSTVTAWIQTPKARYVFSTPTQRLGYRTLRLCGIWASVSSALFLCIAIVMMRQQIRPLRRISEWFRRVTPDHIPELPRIEGAREIRRIGLGLRSMVQRLQEEFEQRHQFLLDLSHDLRSPLARMKLQCRFLPPSPDLIALESDIDHMITMVNRYLELTCHTSYPKSWVPIVSFLQSIQTRPIPAHLKITWNLPSGVEYWVHGHGSDLQRCWQNILDNACKFASAQIHVSLFAEITHVVLCIQDDGLGIPEAIANKVFNPFFKGDASRGLDAGGGSGLGLAITQRFVRAHQGRVYVVQGSCAAGSLLGGAHIHIELPYQDHAS
jgi:two-component system osmolarity sensor histidine kinase EnvZ